MDRREPWTEEEFIAHQPADKRQKYLSALGKKVHNAISVFVKKEKMSTERKYKAPRLVQARNAGFMMAVGKYTRPLEDRVYAKDRGSKHWTIAKCMNMTDLAGVILWKYLRVPDCVMVCLDHSSFDAHVTPEALGMFWRFVEKHYPTADFRRLKSGMMRNRSYSRHGDKYSWTGTVASGDITTSFSDCIINLYILRHWMKHKGVPGEVLVNGDDSILFVPRAYLPCFVNIVQELRAYNMETGIEAVAYRPEEVIFCRMSPWCKLDGSYTMGMDASRMEAEYGTYCRLDMNPMQYQHALAMANVAMYAGTSRQAVFEQLHEEVCDGQCEAVTAMMGRLDGQMRYRNRLSGFACQVPSPPRYLLPQMPKVNIPTWQPSTGPIVEVDTSLKHLRIWSWTRQ